MQKVKSLRNYGSSKKYYNDYLGYNSRLDEIQAGFLSKKLNILDDINSHKRDLAKLYLENLDNKYIKPVVEKSHEDVYHIFAIRYHDRDRLKDYLFDNKIKTEIHYPVAPHKQNSMLGIIDGEYPISKEIHDSILSLPISYFHSREDIFIVIEAMNRFS
jgi:dTDP-4-amino-4,6-dideoxygalactose transaminase